MLDRKPRRHAALVALCLIAVLAVAGLARAADGDDDAGFGAAGAVYVALGEDTLPSSTLVDQAPDGTLVAGVIDWRPQSSRRGGATDTELRILRISAAGAVLDDGTATPIALPDGGGELFDLRVLADGRVVVVGHLFNDPLRRLFVAVRAPSGPDILDFAVLPGCSGSPPADARIRPDGGVVAVWRDCEPPDASLLQRFELTDDGIDAVWEDEVSTQFDDDVVLVQDIALLDGGDIFVSGRIADATDESSDDRRRRGAPLPEAAVQRYDEDGGRVETYGDEGTAVHLGSPSGLAVGADGRAVVALRKSGETWGFVSFDPNGEPDTVFGTNGVANVADDELCCEGATAVALQPDGKVVALKAIDNDSSGADPTIVARLTREGTLDGTFGGDGVRVFDFTDDGTQLMTSGDPALQSDGRVVIALTATRFPPRGRIAPPSGSGHFATLYRLGGVPATPASPTQTTATPAAPPPVTGPVAVARSQAARTCKSRRSFTIRLRTGRKKAEQSAIVSAVVRVNGKRAKVTAGERRTSRVSLEQLPKGRFTVEIRLRLKDGGTVRDTRRYRTCAKKVERELAPLRTSPPRR